MPTQLSSFLVILIIIGSGAKLSESARVFTIINDCKETIWPGVIPGDNFNGGGFQLKPGQSMIFNAPVSWSGRIWGRTGCNFDNNGVGSCQTGDCGPSLKCSGSGKPPSSLAEFTLASPDFYDVSLVDGFNLPLTVKAINGKGNCSTAGCDGDLRVNCPSELAVKANGRTIGCRSACDVFQTDEYCCKGVHGNPSTCQPTYYSKNLRVLVRQLIVMRTTILLVFLHAPGRIMSLHSALTDSKRCVLIIIRSLSAAEHKA
ncbi:hypothetical protein IFM89_001859 [Coptis chinensis]|uniref:Thaumatin-like protein n=1 Tax=Coptis chinensis TaxID=261450 RepID=A0A835HKV5_9MAGN|nr:hypothetical protein IFM89_001859 [Coptis chinensis]